MTVCYSFFLVLQLLYLMICETGANAPTGPTTTITAVPNMPAYTSGTSVTLNCSTSVTSPPVTFGWLLNGEDRLCEACDLSVMSITELIDENLDDVVVGNTYSITSINASAGGVYTCIAVNDDGFALSSYTVYVAPAIVSDPEETFLSPGQTLELSCEAESYPDPTYHWEKMNMETRMFELIPDTTNDTYVIDSVDYSDFGRYRCVATVELPNDPNGAVLLSNSMLTDISNDAIVHVSPTNSTSVTPEMEVLNHGDSLVLNCTAEGGPNNTYFWFHNLLEQTCEECSGADLDVSRIVANMVPGTFVGRGMIYEIPSVNASDGGTYECVVVNEAGYDVAIANIYITPMIVQHPQDIFTEYDVDVNFTCEAEAFPAPTYSWQRSDNEGVLFLDVDGQNTTTYSFDPVMHIDAGEYRCIATITNPVNGETFEDTSAVATLYVSPTNSTSVTPEMEVLNHGDSLVLNCTAEGGPNNTYFWFHNLLEQTCEECSGADLDVSRIVDNMVPGTFVGRGMIYEIPSVNASDGGTYECVVVNEAGYDVAIANIYITPMIVQHPQDIFTEYDVDVNFTCEAEAFPAPTYSWQRSDNEGVPFLDVDGQNATTYSFDPVMHIDAGEYRCIATITNPVNGETFEDTSAVATLYVSPNGSVEVDQETIYVEYSQNFTIFCNAQGGPSNTHMWTTPDDANVSIATTINEYTQSQSILIVDQADLNHQGYYTCNVSNPAGYGTASALVVVSPLGITTTIPANYTAERGDNVTFSCLTPAGPDTMYVWLYTADESLCIGCSDDVSLDSILDSSENFVVGHGSELYLTNVNGSSHGGFYQCVAFNDAGFEIAISTLNVVPTILNHAPSIEVSEGSEVILECEADGYPEPDFTWTYVRTGAVESNNSTFTFTSDANLGGEYQCLAENDVGEDNEITVLNVLPEIESNPVDINVSIAVEPIQLSCSASGFPFPSITWQHNGIDIDEISNGNITILENNEMQTNGFCSQLSTTGNSFGTVSSCLVVTDTEISDSGEYVCVATNGFGDAQSSVAIVLVQDEPEAPFDLDVVDVMSRNVTLTWSRPNDNNAPILGYFVLYDHPPFLMDGGSVTEEVMGREETITISDIHPGVTYNFTIIAFNEEGNSTKSDIIQVGALEEAPGGPPTNIQAVATSHTTIYVYWQLPEEIDRHGVITSYDVMYSTDGNEEIVMDVTTTSATLTDLLEYTNYSISVRARTEVGEGPYSEPIIVLTDETLPGPVDRPMPPSNVSSTRATLVWSAPPDPNGIILFYEVEYVTLQFVDERSFSRRKRAADDTLLGCLRSIGQEPVTTVNTTDTSLMVSNLIPFTVNEFRVRAMTLVGFGNFSSPQTFATLPDGPGPISNLEGIALDATSITLQWNYPSCPNGLPTHYNVFFMPGSEPQLPPISSVGYRVIRIPIEDFTTVYTLTSLTQGQMYRIHVQPLIIDDDVTLFGEVDTEIVVELETSVTNVVDVDPVSGQPLVNEVSTSTTTITTRLPSVAAFATQGITNITYYGVIVVVSPDSHFDIETDDFESTYPNSQPYSSRGNRDYYITAGWNDDVPATFEVGDETTTTATRNGNEEEYFNAKLANGRSYCIYVMVHSLSDIGNQIVIRYTEVTCRETRLGYNRDALISTLVIILFIILLIIVIIIILCLWCWRKRQRKGWIVAANAEALPLSTKNPFIQESIILVNKCKEDEIKNSIPVTEFPDYVRKMHNNNDYLLSEEYAYIEPQHSPRKKVSLDPENKHKNRYLNIVAYDHSRVVLEHCPSGSDYINASHIGGYEKSGSFIAAQGPLPNTVGDFWCMVWEQNVSVVAMLTKLEEKDRVKCHQYWPKSLEEEENSTDQYGSLTVKYVAELKQEHYTIRTFTLSMPGKESRLVKQYQFTSWPDHGVPIDAFALLEYLDVIRKEYQPSDGPMVVHCSAGVGRTATFIAIYVQLARIAGEQTVDIYNYVRYMRRQRNMMVQNEKEYIFIHDALLQALIRKMVAGVHVNFGSNESKKDDLSIEKDGAEKDVDEISL